MVERGILSRCEESFLFVFFPNRLQIVAFEPTGSNVDLENIVHEAITSV